MSKEKQVILSWEEWNRLNSDLDIAKDDIKTLIDSKMFIKSDFVGIINVTQPERSYGYNPYMFRSKDKTIVSYLRDYTIYIGGDEKVISKRLIGLIKECQKVSKELAKRQEGLYKENEQLKAKLTIEANRKEKIVYKDKIIYKSWWTKFWKQW